MLFSRFKLAGIAMICAAVSLAAWKAYAPDSRGGGQADWHPGGPEGRGELTIPVEIVEAGKEPRMVEVRVPR